jgi:copper chaperone CopZ
VSCAAAVKAALESVEGCEEAKADWEKGWAWAKYDPKKTSPEKLVEAINKKTAFQAALPKTTEKKNSTWGCIGQV